MVNIAFPRVTSVERLSPSPPSRHRNPHHRGPCRPRRGYGSRYQQRWSWYRYSRYPLSHKRAGDGVGGVGIHISLPGLVKPERVTDADRAEYLALRQVPVDRRDHEVIVLFTPGMERRQQLAIEKLNPGQPPRVEQQLDPVTVPGVKVGQYVGVVM